MINESQNIKKTFYTSVFTVFSIIFCVLNINAQDFVGKEFIVCDSELDTYYFKFNSDSVFFKEDIDDGYSPLSTFSIEGDTIYWTDIDNNTGCPIEDLGTYTYWESGDSLIFQPITDPCDDRLQVLSVAIFKIETLSNLPRLTQTQFNVYPNPVYSTFSIKTSDQNNYDFQLISNNGQVVYKSKVLDSQPYNIEWLAEGIYYLKITDKNNLVISTSKLLKM